MAQVTPLVRITGTAHGVRRVEIPAKPAVYHRDEHGQEAGIKWEAKPASHYNELGVATVGRFGENIIRENNPATIAVVIPDDLVDVFAAGDDVDIYATAWSLYVPARQPGGRGYNTTAFSFAAHVKASADAPQLQSAGPRRRTA